MQKKKAGYLELIIHSLCWIVLTFLFIHYNAISYHYLRGDLMDIPLLFGTFINALLFYFNLAFLFPQYSLKKINILQYALWIFTLTIIFSAVENVFDYYYALKNIANDKIVLQPEEVMFTSAVNFFFLLLSVLYGIIRAWVNNEVVKRRLTEENLRLELNYLKSQISPHFLFNSLNNLYSIAIKNDDNETATGLSKLSALMRFMLDKSDKNLVKLKEEIDYLESYIELQKLRFLDEDDIAISFKKEGDISNFNIVPFILINFVENAFKHGINYKLGSNVEINLSVNESSMIFIIENSNHTVKKTNENPQMGLDNIKKRLELIYGDDFDLSIESNPQKYTVKLMVKNIQAI